MTVSSNVFDVIIVGAGLAGLIAARDLTLGGKRVLVLEARDRIGGRLYARMLKDRAVHVDIGGTWFIPSQHLSVEAELVRYGIAAVETPWPDRFVTEAGALPADMGNLTDDLIAELNDALARAHALVQDEDIGLEEALGRAGVSEDLTQWVRANLRYLNGADLDTVSGADCTGFGAELYAEPDHYSKSIEGSAVHLVQSVASEAGAEIRFSTQVTGIDTGEAGARVTCADGTVLTGAQVICAVPVNTLRDITFTPGHEVVASLAQAGHAGHSTKFWFTTRGVAGFPRLLSATGLIAYARVFRQLPTGEALWVAFTDRPGAEATTLADIQDEIDRVLPGAEVTSLDIHDWNSDPHAMGTWMATRPGQSAQLATLGTMEGPLWFIGGDVSGAAPGTIEGAIETGRAVAARLLEGGSCPG